MAFTSWSSLKTQLLDAMSDGSWKEKSFEADGKKVEFRSLSEIRTYFDFVNRMAAEENGVTYGRTYARGGGLF